MTDEEIVKARYPDAKLHYSGTVEPYRYKVVASPIGEAVVIGRGVKRQDAWKSARIALEAQS